jgi:tripartite-type tricarboxylate transporter receptor subunit TctC
VPRELTCGRRGGRGPAFHSLASPPALPIVPVAGIARDPFVIEVNPSVPVKTVPELIAYAKANPGKINMASGGIGSGNHIFGELLKMMTGVNLLHVPYRGAGPALVDR